MDEVAFGRYQLIEVIGEGGMGKVYKAHDTVIGRDVAIKVLPAELAAEPGYRERFRREANMAARLTEPHIIPIYDTGEIDGRLYLVMPIITGTDVATLLKHDGRMSPRRAVEIIDQLARALDVAHEHGLVHRDVKPSNALVTKKDSVYLIDFGIAHDGSATTKLTQAGSIVGTWGYMAPERFDTGTADGRADVYALACVLYECLTGRQPYPGDSLEQQIAGHLTKAPPKPTVIDSAVPAGFDEVIARGMAKDPNQRYQSAGELAAAARAALTESPTAAAPLYSARTVADRVASPPPPSEPTAPARSSDPGRPAAQPGVVGPAAQYGGLGPAAQYGGVGPAAQYGGIAPAAQYGGVAPAAQPGGIGPPPHGIGQGPFQQAGAPAYPPPYQPPQLQWSGQSRQGPKLGVILAIGAILVLVVAAAVVTLVILAGGSSRRTGASQRSQVESSTHVAPSTAVASGPNSGATSTPSSNATASPGATGPGKAKVVIDGQVQDASGPVACRTAGNTTTITIGESATGITALLNTGNPPTVEAVEFGMGGNGGLVLAYSQGEGSATATKQGNDYKITGTAMGVDLSNPMAGMVSKPFEIDATCP